MVDITIDRERCRFSLFDPLGCKKCLEVCPLCVFGSVPAQRREAGRPPLIYRLTIPYPELCNGCLACVRACATQALSVALA